MVNVRKLLDGSFSKIGTLAVEQQIRRDESLPCDDILIMERKR